MYKIIKKCAITDMVHGSRCKGEIRAIANFCVWAGIKDHEEKRSVMQLMRDLPEMTISTKSGDLVTITNEDFHPKQDVKMYKLAVDMVLHDIENNDQDKRAELCSLMGLDLGMFELYLMEEIEAE